jgi:PhnB protein
MQVQPYLNFDGRCEEAVEYYRRAVGAEVTTLMRFKDSPEPCSGMAPGSENKVMHSSFSIGDTMVMASDCHCQGKPSFQGFSLSLNPSSETEAQRLFNALSDGGQIQLPLTRTFFSPSFGVVVDKFGISWMIMVQPVATAAAA